MSLKYAVYPLLTPDDQHHYQSSEHGLSIIRINSKKFHSNTICVSPYLAFGKNPLNTVIVRPLELGCSLHVNVINGYIHWHFPECLSKKPPWNSLARNCLILNLGRCLFFSLCLLDFDFQMHTQSTIYKYSFTHKCIPKWSFTQSQTRLQSQINICFGTCEKGQNHTQNLISGGENPAWKDYVTLALEFSAAVSSTE